MKCLHPVTAVLDGKRQYVPCGKCNFCLEARRSEWTFRLRQEMKKARSSYFITMTYEDSRLIFSPSGLPELCLRHLQLFTKSVRKANAHLSSSQVRYYAVGEYGTNTSRPHYHSLMFNLEKEVIDNIAKYWPHGHVMVGTVTPASIHYVTKYHVNVFGDYGDRAPPFCMYVSSAGNRIELHRYPRKMAP